MIAVMSIESIRQRFEAKYVRGEPDDCWEWTASCDDGGYGHCRVVALGETRAHRVAYRLYVGGIPDGLKVRHTCDNPPCVNPKHLILGTQTDNMRDKIERGRQAKRCQSKLGDDQVREIRQLVASGIDGGQAYIGRKFGVTQSTISKIVRRETHAAVSEH